MSYEPIIKDKEELVSVLEAQIISIDDNRKKALYEAIRDNTGTKEDRDTFFGIIEKHIAATKWALSIAKNAAKDIQIDKDGITPYGMDIDNGKSTDKNSTNS